jgi:hypothetical protein
MANATRTGLCPVCRKTIAVGDGIAHNRHTGSVLIHGLLIDVHQGWAHTRCKHRAQQSVDLDRLMAEV